jgi:hypothetical protein
VAAFLRRLMGDDDNSRELKVMKRYLVVLCAALALFTTGAALACDDACVATVQTKLAKALSAINRGDLAAAEQKIQSAQGVLAASDSASTMSCTAQNNGNGYETVVMSGFAPSQNFEVEVVMEITGAVLRGGVVTNSSGQASLSFLMSTGPGQYNINVAGALIAPALCGRFTYP